MIRRRHNRISYLKAGDGSFASPDVHNVFSYFYLNLWSNPVDVQVEDILSLSLPSIGTDAASLLISPISLEEIRHALFPFRNLLRIEKSEN